jgi:tetratricopeptide (TPR) repeat protein
MQQEACDDVLYRRIARQGNEAYAVKKIGAYGADLGAVACFFDLPWSRVSPNLSLPTQAWLLNNAALCLRALGRLSEALEPMRAGLAARIREENWKNAAASASNLSEIELTLGDVESAIRDAGAAVAHADRSGDEFQRLTKRRGPRRGPSSGRPVGRSREALRRGRGDAGGAAARLSAALFAARFSALRFPARQTPSGARGGSWPATAYRRRRNR